MFECHSPDRVVYLRHITVVGLVVRDNEILLVKRAEDSYNEAGLWDTPGGYMERDETMEEAVKREVQEETGYETKVKALFRINDNPDRPKEDTQNVDFMFLLEPVKKVEEHDHEVSEARWFTFDEIPPEKEFAFDHYDAVRMAIDHVKNPVDLPIRYER